MNVMVEVEIPEKNIQTNLNSAARCQVGETWTEHIIVAVSFSMVL